MPRYVWITIRGWVLAFAIASVVAVAYPLVVGGRALAGEPWGLAGFAFMCLLMVSCSFLFALAVIRLRQRVTEVGALICPRCGHDLRGVPEPGRCPECGRWFTLTELRASWRRFVPRK